MSDLNQIGYCVLDIYSIRAEKARQKLDKITFFLYFNMGFISFVFYCFQAAIFKKFSNKTVFYGKNPIFLIENVF